MICISIQCMCLVTLPWELVCKLPQWPFGKASVSGVVDPGITPQWSSKSDLEMGILVATLPDFWWYWVSARTGWHSVSML